MKKGSKMTPEQRQRHSKLLRAAKVERERGLVRMDQEIRVLQAKMKISRPQSVSEYAVQVNYQVLEGFRDNAVAIGIPLDKLGPDAIERLEAAIRIITQTTRVSREVATLATVEYALLEHLARRGACC